MDGVAYVQELCLQLIAAGGTLLGALLIFWLTQDAQKSAAREEVQEQWQLFRRQNQIQLIQWETERKLDDLRVAIERAERHVTTAELIRSELGILEAYLLAGQTLNTASTLSTAVLDRAQLDYVALPQDLATAISLAHTAIRVVNRMTPGSWTSTHDVALIEIQTAKTLFDSRIQDLHVERNQEQARYRLDQIAAKQRIKVAMEA